MALSTPDRHPTSTPAWVNASHFDLHITNHPDNEAAQTTMGARQGGGVGQGGEGGEDGTVSGQQCGEYAAGRIDCPHWPGTSPSM